MPAITDIFNSRNAAASLARAFMYQNQAAFLQSTPLFSGKPPQDSVDFSQMALDNSFYSSLVQGGNKSVFGSIFKDSAAFNTSLMQGVAASAGMTFDSDDSLLGQLVNTFG